MICLSTLAGCQKSPSRTFATVQGVNITIIYPNAGPKVNTLYDRDVTDNKFWKFACNPTDDKTKRVEVVINDLHLRADGQEYGAVQAGDQVTVDLMKGCRVTVNQKERQPEKKPSSTPDL